MNGLIGKEKFVSDLYSNTTSLHPLIVVEGSTPIYISQNEEVISVDGVPIHFKSLNLKVPSIKQSLDLENRKIKTNNITISFSNAENFSDMFAETLLLNRNCKVYWKSPSCESLSDCLLVYSAYVKRVEHDKDNIKLLLEDRTDLVFHREIPSARITPANSPESEAEERIIPMAYGSIKKAPCVLWKKDSDDDSNLYAITDDIDSVTGSARGISHLSHPEGNDLYVYDGLYGKITSEYIRYQPDIDLGLDYNLITERDQLEKLNGFAKILYIYSDTGASLNSASHGFLKASFDRKLSSIKLLDGQEPLDLQDEVIYNHANLSDQSRHYDGMGTNQNFLGASDGYYINDMKKMFQYEKITYDGILIEEIEDMQNINSLHSYASLPSASVANSSNLTLYVDNLGEEFISIEGFYPQTTGIPTYLEEDEDGSVDVYGREYKRILSKILQGSDISENDIEFIYLPDLKEIHGYFTTWYQQNGVDGWRVLGWNDNSYTNSHMMGHTYTWADCRNCMRYNDNVLDYSPSVVDIYQAGDLWFDGGAPFPRPLFRFTLVNDSTGASSDAGFVTFNTNPITGGDVGEFLDYALNSWNGQNTASTGFASVDFWTLIEDISEYSYRGENGQDMPRYVHKSAEPIENINPINSFISGDDIMPSDPIQDFHRTSFNVGWNGVPPSIYGNTYQSGGLTSGSTPYSPWRNKQYSDWFSFFSGESPFVLIKENIQIDGVYLNQGLLIPTVFNFNSTNVSDGSSVDLYGGYNPSVGSLTELQPSYLKLTCNNGTLEEGNVDKVGFLLNFEDAPISDMMQDSAHTQIMPFVELNVNTDSIDDSFDLNNSIVSPYGSEFHRAAIHFLYSFADSRIQGSANEALTGWWTGEANVNWFNTTQRRSLETLSYQGYTEGEIVSINSNTATTDFWTTPSQYNSIAMQIVMSRTRLADDSGGQINPSVELYFKLYGAKVKHLINLVNIESKSYFYNTSGRNIGTNSPTNIIQDIVLKELSGNVTLSEPPAYLNDWKMAFSINESVNSKKLIEDVCRSTPCVAKVSQSGSLIFNYIKNTYEDADVQFLIDSEEIITLSFDRTKIEKVKTLCKVLYELDYSTGEYLSSTYYTDVYDFFGNSDALNGYEDGYRKQYYGLNHNDPADGILEFKSDYIRDHQVARKLRDFLLAYNCNQHNILKIRLPLKFVGIEIGNIVQLTSLLNNKKCFGEDYTVPTTRNGQEIYPYFITTSVTKTIKHIDIVCEQLHNLDKKSNIVNVGSGDILRRGIINPDDLDINTLREFLDGENPYFTEGQMANSDLNGNHFADEGDLSLLEEIVHETNWENIIDSVSATNGEPLATQSWTTNLTNHIDQGDMWGFMNDNDGGYQVQKIYYVQVNTHPTYMFLEDMSPFWDLENITFAPSEEFIPWEDIYPPWYLKVGEEWFKLYKSQPSTSSYPYNGAHLFFRRAQFGTEVSTHSAGEVVEIYNGYPPPEAFGIVVDDFEYEYSNNIELELISGNQDLIATNINPPHSSYPNLDEPVLSKEHLYHNMPYTMPWAFDVMHYANPIITFNALDVEQEQVDDFFDTAGSRVEFTGSNGNIQITSSGIKTFTVPYLTDSNPVEESSLISTYYENSHFAFVSTGEMKNTLPQGTVVTMGNQYNPDTTWYRNYYIALDGFAVLADSISKFTSYKTVRLGITNNDNFMPNKYASSSHENSGIITYGTDPSILDKNGNPAFYMGVRLEDFYNKYGNFVPEVGDRYIIAESKLYGGESLGVGSSEHTFRWFDSVGNWGINPMTGIQNGVTTNTLENQYGAYLYDPAEMIQIKEVYTNNDSNSDMRGVVVIYRDMADLPAINENTGAQLPTLEGEMADQYDLWNTYPSIPTEPITNYLEGGHICGWSATRLLLKVWSN